MLVSACCLGLSCRYHGRRSIVKKKIERLKKKYHLVPVCPEQLGGLPTPRPAAYWDKSGRLKFKCKYIRGPWVLTLFSLPFSGNKGVAFPFLKHGAEEVLRIAMCLDIKKAYLLTGSPSCDPKDGVCAKILRENGVKVATL